MVASGINLPVIIMTQITRTWQEIQPPEALLAWMLSIPDFKYKIGGHSIKFFRTGLPVAVFEVPEEELEKLTTPGNIPDLLGVRHRAGETTWILDLGDKFVTGEDAQFHCLFRSPQINATTLTIDSLQYNLHSKTWEGPGRKDFEEGIIRVLENASLKSQDVLNLCGLCAQLDFKLDTDLLFHMKDSFREEEARKINKKFLLKIFRKIATGAKPSAGFLALDAAGCLDFFLPELARGRGLTQNRYHKHDIFLHSIYSCDAVPGPNLKLRLAALFHDFGKVDTRREKENGEATFHNHEVVSARHTEKIMRRFGFDPWLGKQVKFLVRNHMFHYTAEWTDRAVRRFIQKIEPEVLGDLIDLRLADRKGSGKRNALPRAIEDLMRHIEDVRKKESELKTKDLALDGHGLMEMGYRPGPQMGRILRHLLDRVKSGELANEVEALKEEVRRVFENG